MQSRRDLNSGFTSLIDEVRCGVRHPMFRLGIRECAPLAMGIAAWGLVTGAAMSNSALGVPMALFMTIIVAAGAPQLAALPLIAADAPMWVVWATAVCTNLRFLVFGLYYRPYFSHLTLWRRMLLSYFIGDATFALFNRRYPVPDRHAGQVHYFMGGSALSVFLWQAGAICGILGGQAIPTAWGIGFAGTMALLALTCGQLRDISTSIAALVAASAAVASYALPLRLNIMVAVAVAVAIGLLASAARSRT